MQFKKDQTKEKLRGGYYTPIDLAVFISQWVASAENTNTILEPSCGDGVFFEAIANTSNHHININGFEIEKTEARKAINISKGLNNIHVKIQNGDFLKWYLKDKPANYRVDGIVGNPPFIRYQYLPKDAQIFAEQIFRLNNLPFTRHTNAWVPFVVASLDVLRPGGRFGMILPAEILHVMHAQSLRRLFGQTCKKIVIFDPQDLWFKNTLQGAIILLAEKKNDVNEKSKGISIVRTVGSKFLNRNPVHYVNDANYVNGKTIAGKWTRALLNNDELTLFDKLAENERVFQFGDLADVDVGIVTGANDFFLVPNETASQYRLNKWVHPMFGRSGHCPGVVYNKKQHMANVEKGLPTNFVWFDVDSDKELSPKVKEYINGGEKQNLHKRYKCRIRKPWYKVPSVYSTNIGMLKRASDIPRLIFNEIGAYTTDTAYRIQTTVIDEKKLVSCFINSLTALSAELEGRHYGGGVLELVPSEIEKLLVPIPSDNKINIRELDDTIRNMPAEDTLHLQDHKVLSGIGLTKKDQECIHNGWNKLRKRRQRLPVT